MKIKLFLLFFLINSFCIYSETIEVWHYYFKNLEKQLQICIKNYESKTGNKVVMKKVHFDTFNTKYKMLSKEGCGPDVIIVPSDWIGQFIDKNKEYILKLDNTPETKRKAFIENTLKFTEYNGHSYALPFGINILSLVYNKDFVKTPPKTTKELIQLSKEIKEKYQIEGLVYNNQNYYYHWLWITGFGGDPFKDKKPTFNSKEQLKANAFIRKLQDQKIMPVDLNEEMALSLFDTKNAAMIITGPWEMSRFFKKKMNIGVALLPIVTETGERAMPILGGDVIMISSNSKYQKASRELIDFLTSSESQEIMYASSQFIPAVKNVYDFKTLKNSEFFSVFNGFMEQANYSYPMPRDPELLVGVWAFGGLYLNEILNTNRKIEDIADETQKKAIKVLEEYNKK